MPTPPSIISGRNSSSAAFTTFTDIGSNSANYVVQESDVGSFIRVVATTSDPDNPQSATATSSVTGAAFPRAADAFGACYHGIGRKARR